MPNPLQRLAAVLGIKPRRGRGAFGEWGTSGTQWSGNRPDTEYNAELRYQNDIGTQWEAGHYEKMDRSDAVVRAAFMGAALPIRSAEWDMEPGEGRGMSPDIAQIHADYAAEALFQRLDRRWASVVDDCLDSLKFGHTVLERVFDEDCYQDGKVWLSRLAYRRPQTITEWDVRGGSLKAVRQQANEYAPGSTRNVDEWISADKLVVVCNERRGDNWLGYSWYRPLWPAWRIKAFLLKILPVLHEREALGIPFAMPAPGQTFDRSDIDRLYEILSNARAHEHSAIVLPTNTQLDWFYNASQSPQKVIDTIAMCNQDILLGFNQQALTLGNSANGSRALGDSAQSATYLGLQCVADQIADAFYPLIKQLVDINFGVQAVYPRLTVANLRAKDLGTLATLVGQLVAAGLIRTDRDLEIYVRREFGLPEIGMPYEVKGMLPAPAEQTQSPVSPLAGLVEALKGKMAERSAQAEPAAATQPAASEPVKASARHDHAQAVHAGIMLFQPKRELTFGECCVEWDTIEARFNRAPETLADRVAPLLAEAMQAEVAKLTPADAKAGLAVRLPDAARAAIMAEVEEWCRSQVEFGRQSVDQERHRQSREALLRKRQDGQRAGLPPDRVQAAETLDPVNSPAASPTYRLTPEDYAAIVGGPRDGVDPDAILSAEAQAIGASMIAKAEADATKLAVASMARGLSLAAPAMQDSLAQSAFGIGRGEARDAAVDLVDLGRDAEVAYRDASGDRVRYVERSALLDGNACEHCRQQDSDSQGGPGRMVYGSPEHQANLCPDPECAGGQRKCRCMLVYVWESEGSVLDVQGQPFAPYAPEAGATP